MKSEVLVGRDCGWIRVSQAPGKVGTLVYLNKVTPVGDVTRDLLLPPDHTIWIQYGGGEPRALGRTERPLELQEDFLEKLGFTEPSRRARLGIDTELRHLVAFLTGPKWYSRSGEVWVLKGLVLPQWRKRRICLREGYIIIYPPEEGGRAERGKVMGGEEGAWPRGGRHVLKVVTPARSIYLGMEEPWQRSLWSSWLADEEKQGSGDLRDLGLTRLSPEEVADRAHLDLSHNRLGGSLLPPPCPGAVRPLERLSLSENDMDTLQGPLPRTSSLDLSGNRLQELPPDLPSMEGLEELRLDRNLLTRLPPGRYRHLRRLSAALNRIDQLPSFLEMRSHRLIDIQEAVEESDQPEELEYVNLRGNCLKGTIILGNYGNLTQLDVSENSIECLDLTALERLQNVQCSRNRLQELSLNGSSLISLIAGNNCLTKLTIHPRPAKLRHLDISYNRLECLPEWVTGCPQLRTLFASHNYLSCLPERLLTGADLGLQTLQLSFNRLARLPPLTRPVHLQQLFLQANCIARLSTQFFSMTPRLRTLNLTKNELDELPEEIPEGHLLERLYLTCNQLSHIDSLVKLTNLRVLHVAYNVISQLPPGMVEGWRDMEELVVSGNRLEYLPEGVATWPHLRVLRLHCNLITTHPHFGQTPSLKVLDLSHNNLEKVNLSALIPKQLQFLDVSGNMRLQVDPRQFRDYRSQREMSLVDTSGKGRMCLPSAPQENGEGPQSWTLGFSETPGNRERLCISQLRLSGFCGNEALLGLFDSGNDPELPKLIATSIPRILLEERTVKETANEYMKYTLLAAHRELKEKGQRVGCCALVCHMCSERGSGLRKRTLRVATVGEAKAVLARASSSLTLAHVPTSQILRSQMGNSAMFPMVVPDPHVTEVTLRDDDRFLIMANKRLWEVVSAEEAATEARLLTDPCLAAKRLQDLAQSYGCEDNISVIVISLYQPPPVGYRLQEKGGETCWCHTDRSSPSGQSDQASCGQESSRDTHLHYIIEKNESREKSFEPVLMRENGTRKMTSRLHDGHLADGEESPSERSQMSEEQFRCWEYMLEQNTQLLFDKELGSISKRTGAPHARLFGSTRSATRSTCCRPNSAYFGSVGHIPQYISAKEKSDTDSLEMEDRMSKYWDVATTEL